MNIRHTLAVLTLGLASSMAMAATPQAAPATPATPATKAAPATPAHAKAKAHKAKMVSHTAKECAKKGETLVKGKCVPAAAHS